MDGVALVDAAADLVPRAARARSGDLVLYQPRRLCARRPRALGGLARPREVLPLHARAAFLPVRRDRNGARSRGVLRAMAPVRAAHRGGSDARLPHAVI